MKKSRKPRVGGISYETMITPYGVYYLITPYDRKSREIPSSVQCAYNTEYITPDQALKITQVL